MRLFALLLVAFLPWRVKLLVLNRFFGFDLSPKAYIGLSLIAPKHLVMKEGARIGHLNVAIHLDKMFLGKNSMIVRSNWITGFPVRTESRHFSHQPNRDSSLYLGDESSVTKHHHIDCTNTVTIGKFVTVAGYSSQFLTHSIDIYKCRQDSRPIVVGDYCFIGTGVKVLGGAILPDRSVLAAGAVLTRPYTEEWKIYGGVPAKPIKDISSNAAYFNRPHGFVY